MFDRIIQVLILVATLIMAMPNSIPPAGNLPIEATPLRIAEGSLTMAEYAMSFCNHGV